MFTPVPSLKDFEINTTTVATTTKERLPQHGEDEEREPTIDATSLEATTSQTPITGMVYMSAAFIQDMAQ